MLGSFSTVLAANEGSVTAVFAEFNLLINGQEKQLETTPLVYNGTSYLPVREMANLVGYDVTYKADTRTIELSNTITTESGDSTMTTTTDTEWISFDDLFQKYNVSISVGDQVTLGNLTFERPSASQTGIVTVQTERGGLDVQVENSRFFVKLSDMERLGIID